MVGVDRPAAATAVASGRATEAPKTRDGIVEAFRAPRVPRRSAVEARAQARQLLVTDPEVLQAELRGL